MSAITNLVESSFLFISVRYSLSNSPPNRKWPHISINWHETCWECIQPCPWHNDMKCPWQLCSAGLLGPLTPHLGAHCIHSSTLWSSLNLLCASNVLHKQTYHNLLGIQLFGIYAFKGNWDFSTWALFLDLFTINDQNRYSIELER